MCVWLHRAARATHAAAHSDGTSPAKRSITSRDASAGGAPSLASAARS
jgi:hypothetical protein